MLSKPLHWLSMVDRDVLKKCTRLPDSERKRFTEYGGLVLIPATIGGIAMGYACYTFFPNFRVAVVGGVLWFLIVMWVDRFISGTLHKSSLISPYYFWAAFLVRLLLAGTIGYGLAHPAMLFLFRQKIEQQMADEARARKLEVFKVSDAIKSTASENLNKAKECAF